METYPEQFPDESQPDPSHTGPRTASLTLFQDGDGPGSRQPARGSRTPRRRKWTSPYGYRAWAASACRSRISGSP